MMEIVYTGPKASRILELPVPLLAKSDKTGELVFQRGIPMTVETPLAEQLARDFPDTFRLHGTAQVAQVQAQVVAKKSKADKIAVLTEKALAKRWVGKTAKWSAKRYVAQHALMDYVEIVKTDYGWRLQAKPAAAISGEPEGPKETHGSTGD